MIHTLTLVVISYEIYETRQRLVSQIPYEMPSRVRVSIVLAHASITCIMIGFNRPAIL